MRVERREISHHYPPHHRTSRRRLPAVSVRKLLSPEMIESNSVEAQSDVVENPIMASDTLRNARGPATVEIQECLPLRTLSEVWSWRKDTWPNLVGEFSPRISLVVPGDRLQCVESVQPRLHKDSVPRTIFCHDLKGGYLEDRFANGSDRSTEYRFFHWAGIDTFIYFSHHLLTIPPAGWINAGHRHGVPVLGTLITEGEEGFQVWEQILTDHSTVLRFADTLALICEYYRFDGYLLNVENPIPKDRVPLLVSFVSELRQSLYRVGKWYAQVIWYDSVTCDGALRWQNKLNHHNRCFFDVCDGIFLNYSWNEDDLDRSITAAGPRCHDVYVGVDVFGRNCFGGGGFNSDKALKVIRSKNLSVALFAASWTHETLRSDNFLHLEYLFWQKLWPYLYIHGPFKLPFSTSFCQGYGARLYLHGEMISSKPWYNLSKQSQQPSLCSSLTPSRVAGARIVPLPSTQSDASPVKVLETLEPKCSKITRLQSDEPPLNSQGYLPHWSQDAFNGGGCLQIGGPGSYSMRRMLLCGFVCTGNVLISIATKVLSPKHHQDGFSDDLLYLTLLVKNKRSYSKEILVSEGISNTEKHTNECGTMVHRPLNQNDVVDLCSSFRGSRLLAQLSVGGKNGWKVRHYSLRVDGLIMEIGAEVDSPEQIVLLGWLAVSLQTS